MEKHTSIVYLMLFRKVDSCPRVMFPLIWEAIKRKMNGDVKAKKKKRGRREVDQIEWDMSSVNSLTSKIELKK